VTTPATEDWYTRRDARRNLAPHCPLAANDKCPRYYLSQKHAASASAATQAISEEARTQIEKSWEASDVFASIEQSVATWFAKDGSLIGVDGFCPEVTAKLFGLYCSQLRAFPDEETRGTYHRQLFDNKMPEADPRWEWMLVEPRHYTECTEYSVYANGGSSQKKKGSKKRALPLKLRWTVIERDRSRCVYCGRTSEEVTLHVDHRKSVADGGDNGLDNLVTACEECNLGKGAKSAA
jgi:HNH endonuclease